MIKTITTITAAAVAGALAIGTANAATIDFTTDDTPPVVAGNVLGVGYTVTSNGTITNDETSVGSTCVSILGLACARDGFGVGDDEVSTSDDPETLTVTFDEEVQIQSFSILDLFRSPETDNFEVGQYSIDDGATFINFGSAANELPNVGLSGALIVSLGGVLTDKIIFRAPFLGLDANDGLGVNDFAVAGIEVVPLPGAAFLLLSGLAGLGFAGRKKKAA